MGALLLTKFSKVRSNSLNSSRLLYLAAWIVSRIFGLQSYAVIQDLKAVDQHAVEVDLAKHSATGTIRFGVTLSIIPWRAVYWAGFSATAAFEWNDLPHPFRKIATRRSWVLPQLSKYIQRRHINIRIDSTSSQLLEQREDNFRSSSNN